MVKFQGSTQQEVSPQLAQDYLDKCVYLRQRNIRTQVVDRYASAMTEGMWMPDKEIKMVYFQGRRYLVNGQHRLRAVIQSNTPQSFVISTWMADNQTDLDDIYSTEDTGSSRHFGDIARSQGLDSDTGLSITDLNSAKAAIQFIKHGFTRTSGKPTLDSMIMVDLVRETYSDAIHAYLDIADGCNGTGFRRKMLRAPIFAVALVTLTESASSLGSERVLGFWTGLAEDDGLRAGDPRKVAREHLVSTTLGSSRSRDTMTTANYTARYIANCFNAWISDSTYSTSNRASSKVADAHAPIKIVGSQWK